MRIPKVSDHSRSGGPSTDGGKGLFAEQPSARNDSWKDYLMDFMVITDQKNPFLGYIDHFFPVIDPTNVPPREDGSKPTWLSAYCLASPTDQTAARIAPVAERVPQCRSIIIPGTDIPLHDCDSLSRPNPSRGGDDKGQTRYMYRAIIFNWTTKTIQILDMKEGRWEGLFTTLEEEYRRLGDEVNILQYNWRLAAEPLSGAAPYRVVTKLSPIHYTMDDARRIRQENEAAWMERWQACLEAFNPAQTEEQIRRKIGAVIQAPTAASPMAAPTPAPVATAQPLAGGAASFEELLGQGSDIDAEQNIANQLKGQQ